MLGALVLDLEVSELGPTPDGSPLAVAVRCHGDPSHSRWSTHELVLREGWDAEVPHDLDAERVLLALGGYSSCPALVERAVPAAREHLHRALRLRLPRLSRLRSGQWRCRQPRSCCPRYGFATAADAVDHWRTPLHVAGELRADAQAVGVVGAEVLRAHDVCTPVPLPAERVEVARACVLESAGVLALWRAGLPPEAVRRVHDRVAVDARPLPIGFYLGVLTNRPDLAWIRAAAAQAPAREVEEWLAWSETAADRRDPSLRPAWLRTGASRRDIPTLVAADCTPADVEALAIGLRCTGAGAGALLSRWVRAGCRPVAADLVALHRLAAPGLDAVNGAALDRLQQELVGVCDRAGRGELAQALAVCGTPALAATAVAQTRTTDPHVLTGWMRAFDDPAPCRAADRGSRSTADA